MQIHGHFNEKYFIALINKSLKNSHPHMMTSIPTYAQNISTLTNTLIHSQTHGPSLHTHTKYTYIYGADHSAQLLYTELDHG